MTFEIELDGRTRIGLRSSAAAEGRYRVSVSMGSRTTSMPGGRGRHLVGAVAAFPR